MEIYFITESNSTSRAIKGNSKARNYNMESNIYHSHGITNMTTNRETQLEAYALRVPRTRAGAQ